MSQPQFTAFDDRDSAIDANEQYDLTQQANDPDATDPWDDHMNFHDRESYTEELGATFDGDDLVIHEFGTADVKTPNESRPNANLAGDTMLYSQRTVQQRQLLKGLSIILLILSLLSTGLFIGIAASSLTVVELLGKAPILGASFGFWISCLAMLAACVGASKVVAASPGSSEMIGISEALREGSMAFVRREYLFMALFIFIVAILVAILLHTFTAIAYLIGALIAAAVIVTGMHFSILVNLRVCASAQTSLNAALRLSFLSSVIISMSVVGLGLCGLSVLLMVFRDVDHLVGFGFGISSVTLFARLLGGIFAKGAHVAHEQLTKLDASIPELDPRNPALIADHLGTNVVDVGGASADFLESVMAGIIAAVTIASKSDLKYLNYSWNVETDAGVALPFYTVSWGMLCAIIGAFVVRTTDRATVKQLLWKFRLGVLAAATLIVLPCAILVLVLDVSFTVFLCMLLGLLCGIVALLNAEIFSGSQYPPVRSVATASQTSPSRFVEQGLAAGIYSCLVPICCLAFTLFVSLLVAGDYGIAMAAVGMLSIVVFNLSMNIFGPISDHAKLISSLSDVMVTVRSRTQMLDSVGSVTLATGRDFSITSATLVAVALSAAYCRNIELGALYITDPSDPLILPSLFLGSLLPFIFSALNFSAVGKTAEPLVAEVRRLYNDPAILRGESTPDYPRCVKHPIKRALQHCVLPAAICMLVPVFIGLVIGPKSLAGLLIGSIITGYVLALSTANSGSAWDSARQHIEAGFYGGNGSEAYKTSLIGDEIGKTFRDCSGLSICVLLKFMAMVALLISPVIKTIHD